MRLSVGLLAVCLSTSFSACQRPTATVQRSPREHFYTRQSHEADPEPVGPSANVPEPAEPPVVYADARPGAPAETPAQRTQAHQQRVHRLSAPPRPVPNEPLPDSPPRHVPADEQVGPGPKEKQRKTLREILGLPPKKKLNWWQRIPWQLKAATVVTLVAVVFAILGITTLTIVFGVIGAVLLIRGLKKSFKVRRGLFGLGG